MTDKSPKRRVFAWMMFDWASQPFYTLCLTFIFGPYFAAVATQTFIGQGLPEAAADANAQSLWSLVQTLTGLIIAFTAPVLGAMADNSGRPMRWVVAFSTLYVVGVWGLWGLMPDGSGMTTALISFAVAMIGVEYATIFTNAMLPGLGDRAAIGKISGSGFALGYAGGVVSLFAMLLFLAETDSGTTLIGLAPAFGLDPSLREGTRAVGPFSAIWYLVFMVPFFLWLRQGVRVRVPGGVRRALADSRTALRSVLTHRSLAAYLVSSMLYRDALVALYGFGGVYATLVLDWSVTQIGVFGILGAVSAALASWIGGRIDSRIGPKPVILVMVLILTTVCTVIVSMTREAVFGIPLAPGSSFPDIAFYVLGAAIGAAGGILQACSRSLMVRHADPDRPTVAFGLYALSGKATAFLAPALIGLVTYLTESARLGISPLIALFLLALILLSWVHPDGDRAAP